MVHCKSSRARKWSFYFLIFLSLGRKIDRVPKGMLYEYFSSLYIQFAYLLLTSCGVFVHMYFFASHFSPCSGAVCGMCRTSTSVLASCSCAYLPVSHVYMCKSISLSVHACLLDLVEERGCAPHFV